MRQVRVVAWTLTLNVICLEIKLFDLESLTIQNSCRAAVKYLARACHEYKWSAN